MVNFARRPLRSAICKKKKEESVLLGDRKRHILTAKDVPSSCLYHKQREDSTMIMSIVLELNSVADE